MTILRAILPLLLVFGAVRADEGIPDFPEAAAWEFLVAQCAFGPRVPGTAGHRKCLDYLEATLASTGAAAIRQDFRTATDASRDTLTLTNLTARYGPPGAPLLLGAHWDTRPWADRDRDPGNRKKPILGANDGASGVAVLLALATILRTHPPPLPVEIALFDGEDQAREGSDGGGYILGSRAHVRGRVPPLPRAVVIVDMVGARDMEICREEVSDLHARQLNDLIFARAAALGLPAFRDEVSSAVLDDHVPFLEAGIPAVDLIDTRYRQWHTLEDLPGACSRESLGQVGRLLTDLVYGGYLQ